MQQEEALRIAQKVADQEGWSWLEPVRIQNYRVFFFMGKKRWNIRTNMNSRGGNILIVIDDKSGNVVKKEFWPR